jgi:hypothetical protein
MKTAASFIGLLIASHQVISRTRPEATPGKPPAPSVLAMLKPKRWTQGPPVASSAIIFAAISASTRFRQRIAGATTGSDRSIDCA